MELIVAIGLFGVVLFATMKLVSYFGQTMTYSESYTEAERVAKQVREVINSITDSTANLALCSGFGPGGACIPCTTNCRIAEFTVQSDLSTQNRVVIETECQAKPARLNMALPANICGVTNCPANFRPVIAITLANGAKRYLPEYALSGGPAGDVRGGAPFGQACFARPTAGDPMQVEVHIGYFRGVSELRTNSKVFTVDLSNGGLTPAATALRQR
jgi:hypothetical protein